MLSRNAKRALKLLKETQICPSFSVPYESMTSFETIRSDGKEPTTNNIPELLNLEAAIDELTVRGFIKPLSYPPDSCHVTIEGWYYFDVQRRQFWRDLFFTFIIPALVAIVAAVITTALRISQ